MYSVKFNIKNGKKYYARSNAKYHLEDEDMMLDDIPMPLDADTIPYYYYKGGEWIFDSNAYDQSMQEITQSPVSETVTTDEVLDAIMELAENVSDIEDALVELAGMEG